MSKTGHFIYITIFVTIIAFVLIVLIYNGISYYSVSMADRYYHPGHGMLKSSGYIGHGLGIAGSVIMITGVGAYMARKRYRFLSRLGVLKYWLEFHIFMCVLGTILIVFHAAFKVHGLAAISFWSMLISFTSGIAGRFIYLQIPRANDGRELNRFEAMQLKTVAVANRNNRLVRQIERLDDVKELFRYWHIFHLPFAILMLFFMMIHAAVTILLGYRWIL